MKEKLSFLALPFCLGLVITIVLAACSSGGGGTGPSHETSSSSGNSGGQSSDVQVPGVLEIDPFSVYIFDKKAIISGTVTATPADPVARLEFLINNSSANANWISYQGETVNGSINVPKTVILNIEDAEINLKNENIPCEEVIIVTVKAYNSSGKVAIVHDNFKKPSNLCPVSSSAGAVSSSSAVVWRFGQPVVEDVDANTPIHLGNSGGSFELVGNVPIDGQPDLKVYYGKVRPANPCKENDLEDIKPGEPYSSEKNCLGNTPATVSKLSEPDCVEGGFKDDYGCYAQPEEYFLIYLNDGSKYLLQFKPIDESTKYTAWPKKGTYWEVLEPR